MSHTPLVIAIDGPAASGKGTVAKAIAKVLGFAYLDTGSIYRAVAYQMVQKHSDPEQESAAIQAAKDFCDKDLNNPNLYNEGVGRVASIISAIPEVRAILMDYQKRFAKAPQGAVLDGRDIGTVICPEADFKFFITADLETRAQRRYKQLQNKDSSIIYQAVLDDLKRRDERDSQREIAPLTQTEDAIFIDTSDLGIDDVVRKVLDIIA